MFPSNFLTFPVLLFVLWIKKLFLKAYVETQFVISIILVCTYLLSRSLNLILIYCIYVPVILHGHRNRKFLGKPVFLFFRFMSYSKCSNCRRISKLSWNFGCLFTFSYLDGANSIKTDLHICNLWTGQFVSYKSVI